jgi:inorganic triphosphatase YgiF
MTHRDANFGYTVAFGSSSEYPSRGIPHSALIRADGTVAYVGNPGSMSGKLIEEELKKVKKPSPEMAESKASKMLAAAEANIEKKQLLVAESILSKIVAKFPASESGKKAAARVKEIATGDFKAEWDAQKDVAKLIGGNEKPAEADSKKFQKIAKAFLKKAEEYKESAPVASAIATEWADIAASPWK